MLHLITGGAGFIGSTLADQLVADGEDVIILDNLATGQVRNLERALSSGRATFVFGDVVAGPTDLAALLAGAIGKRKAARLWHLASSAAPPVKGNATWDALAVDGVATMAVIELALELGARMLFASHPDGQDEASHDGKRFGEAATVVANGERGLDGRIVRLPHCYGPRMREGDGGLIARLLAAAGTNQPVVVAGSSSQVVSAAFVNDVVAEMRLAMESPQTVTRPIGIRSENGWPIAEIVAACADVAGARIDVRYVAEGADGPLSASDLPPTREHLGESNTPLEAGLRATWRWLKEERVAFA